MEGAVLHCLLVTHLLCSVATMSQLLYIKAVDNANETIAVMHSKVMQPEPVPQPYENTGERLSHISNISDADFAGDPDTGRSTGSYVVKMGTGAISWNSKLQSIVTHS